jgi:CO/xanthine dehydrogenase Mo-binding subunit
MRHVAFGRSPLAHARIRLVDATAARQVPGVLAVFTGHDPAFAAVALRAVRAAVLRGDRAAGAGRRRRPGSVEQAAVLVDINRIPGLAPIQPSAAGGLRAGELT